MEAASSSSLSASVVAEVAVQLNSRCSVAREVPSPPPVDFGVPSWEAVGDPVEGGQLEIGVGGNGVAADFDGDGMEDVLVPDDDLAERTPGKLHFWRNVGGRLEDATTEVLGEVDVPSDVSRRDIVADFNGDGVPDVFRGQHGWDFPPFPQATDILLLSEPGGVLENASHSHLSPNQKRFTHGAASPDVDCDGDSDLFVSNIAVGSSSQLYVNQGGGSLVDESERLPTIFANGDVPVLAAGACDIDRDGDDDLVTGLWETDSPRERNILLINDGFGNFRRLGGVLPKSYFGENGITPETYCVDMNLDGWPDVVELSSDIDTDVSGGAIWINRGGLEFDVVDLSAEFPGLLSIQKPVEINGDGWPDLAIRLDDHSFRILLNRGDFSFDMVGIPFAAPQALVDADGDGLKDMLMTGNKDPDTGCCEPPELHIQRR